MDKEDFEDYERRSRLYHNAFEEYNSLETTYRIFYKASDAFKRRGRVLTYGSTIFGAVLLYLIGTVAIQGRSTWETDVSLAISIIVAALSFLNAVDSPQRMSNVTYNSGQTLQRVFLDFHYFVTVRLPDPDEDLQELEKEYERLLERKHTVNETTPQLSNKWYKRLKEEKKSWKPKPLVDVTGEEGEFIVENEDDEEDALKRVKNTLRNPIVRTIRWLGY